MIQVFLRPIRATAWVTFLEIMRDRVLYNIILVSGLLFTLGFLASRLSVIRQDRLMINFGITGLSISCLMIAIFSGATMIGREFERRTIFVALSRPISRLQFVMGKFLGLCGVILVNWIGMIVALCAMYFAALGESGLESFSHTLLVALALVAVQSCVLAAIAVFFSTFSTASLSVMFTLGLYLVGTNISQIRLLSKHVDTVLASSALNFAATILPNFERFSLGTSVAYGLPVGPYVFEWAIAYGALLCFMFILGSGFFVDRRES